MAFDLSRFDSYPDKPGVYLMKDEEGSILYIGKAKNLKARIRQYFIPGRDDRVQVPYLIASLHDVETIIVETEKDALILEARLIRKWKPKYNILLKDDRSRLMIRIGLEHDWPRIEYIRSKEVVEKPPKSFGPFPYTKEMFDLTVRLFQIRQCSNEEFKRRSSPCILHQIHACSAPCVQKITKDHYSQSVREASDFLAGNVSWIREALYQEMMEASDRLEFEKAQRLHERIKILDSVTAARETDQIQGIQNSDVVGIWHEGSRGLSIEVSHYRGGMLQYSEGWVFDLSEQSLGVHDIQSTILSLLIQLYQERAGEMREKERSQNFEEIIIPEILSDAEASLQEALSDIVKRKIAIKVPLIGPKAKVLRLSTENAKARLLQKAQMQDLLLEVLSEMMKECHLTSFPHHIDCFDASHFGGKERVATCISFLNGLPNKKRYRTFKVEEHSAPNDLIMIQEALLRRYKQDRSDKERLDLPNLILIDGGKTQLNAAKEALERLGLAGLIDLLAVTKESGRHDKGMTREKLYGSHLDEPILLSTRSPLLHFIQRIRDEAHRFSIQFQKKQRSKSVRKSFLDNIIGIGPKKKAKILRAFAGLQALTEASEEEIISKSGISKVDAEAIMKYIHSPLGHS